ncbi:hypothetical protein L7F22_041981 [Adiantum nelumboides]|nr:hypothetical protein [Adiantum nelumboides]
MLAGEGLGELDSSTKHAVRHRSNSNVELEDLGAAGQEQEQRMRRFRQESLGEKAYRYRGVVFVVCVPLLLIIFVLLAMPRHPVDPSTLSSVDPFDHHFPHNLGLSSSSSGLGSDNKYAVVFDAGSSGSRVHVYCFGDNLELIPIGNEMELFRQEQGGLSSYAMDPEGGANSLRTLLNDAINAVPSKQRSETPVRLGATAGLRTLPGSAAQKLLEAVTTLLTDSPFKFQPDWVSILDGTQEGAYEWVTINYLLGNIGQDFGNTVGVVDLGGGSVQMAYAISEDAAEIAPKPVEGEDVYVKQLNLLGKKYYLYVHSYLHYGLLAARAEVLKLVQGKENCPCLAGGFKGEYIYGSEQFAAEGSASGADFRKCQKLLVKALNKDHACEHMQCTFGGIWSGGGGDGQNKLFVASFFFDRALQGSDLQAMQQVFPPPSIHPGYFGGGSVFQSMAGHAPGNQFYTSGTVFGGAQTTMPNPMYGGIGLQPGFQSTQGQFGMPQASFGMAGIANQQPYMTSPGQLNSGQRTQINPNSVPMFQSLPYDNLTPLEKPTPYKEGGKGVTFTTFTGFDDRKKALSFLQQFDKAYAGGNFTEASKVRKAATYLTGNAGQWWTTLLLQGQAPSTWIYFKQIFASAWLSDDFEADVMTEWHPLNAASCKNLDDYNRKFWKALLPVTFYRLCVTRPLRRKVMEESHVPPYAGHCGIDATVKAVETFFYWPALRRDVDVFVRECIICQKVKFDRQKAPGLLQPLPIPDKPWESIAMDFIFDLPRTQTGNDGIWTIICRFSKQAHFIPVRKKIKPDQMACLFMSNVFKYHGMPQSIVSDRDPRMTSLFWRGLFENMGTTLKFSSSFHPQTDGQSEEANSTVLDLLKCYVSEYKGKWEQYLPLVEYADNNTVHSSIGKAPFEIVEGGKKVPPILHTKDKIFEADKYVQDMDEMYKKVKVALEKTQAKQKKAADSHRREVVFSLGDWVLLHFEKARLKKMKGKERLFPKLSMRYYGPFQVCDKISDVAYRLKLPESWRIHNAFHVTLLRPYVGDVPEDLPAEDQDIDEILVP